MKKNQSDHIYPLAGSIKRKKEALRKAELPQESVRLILRFVEKCAAEGLSLHRQSFYLTQLRGLAEILGEAFANPSREDIERTVAEIEGRNYSDWTKTNYKTALKRFYKWHLGDEEEYPPQVRWVKTRKSGNHTLPEGLLTPNEIRAMVHACKNPRDRALISSLADSGCRIGELLSMRVGDVTFDEYGVVFRVSGKTGDRRVRVIGDAIPYLSAWIEAHPSRSDPHAPLWVGQDERTAGKPIKYATARKVLKTAARKGGVKKRVYAHLFRHTRATELARKVTEAPLEEQMGWVHGSGMAKVYVHLSGRDVDRAILEAEGIELPAVERGGKRKLPKVCPRCEAVNLSNSRFCRRCRLPLTSGAVEEVEGEMEKFRDVRQIERLLEDPKVQHLLSLLDKALPPSKE